MMKLDDPLNIEGLAAQLYSASTKDAHYVWWHLLREEIKGVFRQQARKQISDYVAETPF